ncbi:MAG: hypothetical protein NZO58_11395, partial [Gemmataceae bacterium]|nr:hypothetical protein [Gemmataceae bacterium]
QDGIWSELRQDSPKIDACRRALQRAYLDILKNEIAPGEAAPKPLPILGDDGTAGRNTDLRAVGRAALRDLLGRIEVTYSRTQDPMTRIHLQDCRKEIEEILHPNRK